MTIDEKSIRIQRRRTRGWRMPLKTRCVTRPGKFGNPFPTACLFKHWLEVCVANAKEDPRLKWEGKVMRHMQRIADNLHELRGLNLACYCKLPKPGEPDLCHAAVLLSLANRTVESGAE